jgi:hypothetical protein
MGRWLGVLLANIPRATLPEIYRLAEHQDKAALDADKSCLETRRRRRSTALASIHPSLLVPNTQPPILLALASDNAINKASSHTCIINIPGHCTDTGGVTVEP